MWATDSLSDDVPQMTREQYIALLDGTFWKNRIAELISGGFTREEAEEMFDFETRGFCPSAAIHALDPETLAELGLV